MKFIIYILEKMTGGEKKRLKDTQRFISGWLRMLPGCPRTSQRSQHF